MFEMKNQLLNCLKNSAVTLKDFFYIHLMEQKVKETSRHQVFVKFLKSFRKENLVVVLEVKRR